MIVTAQRGEAFAGYNQLEVQVCADCGVLFAIPERMCNALRENGRSFYCPNGHSLSWRETTVDRERRLREKAEEQLRFARQQRDAEHDLRQHTEDRLRAQKGATTRAKKRHAAGVCPCCNRSFQNVVRHMESQHPDFDPAKPAS